MQPQAGLRARIASDESVLGTHPASGLPQLKPLFSCYTEFVAKNVTIRISDEAAHWARRQAAEQNSSLSRLVGEMLERQMRLTDEYWRAFDHWKSNRPLARAGAAERLSREELHERR